MDLNNTLYGLDPREVQGWMKANGFPAYRANQILEWVYKKLIIDFEEAKNLPKDLKEKIKSETKISSLTLTEARNSGNRESTKFLFKTYDDQLLESVLITQKDRQTVCVSTQLGCKVGCIFCASGKGKFGRNLSAGEIIEQVAWVQRKIGMPVTNVVFMGMGEPMDNFEATMKALKILQAPWGFGMSSRRITVSTSGITPKILEFVKRSEGRVRLSVSLHSSKEDARTRLVPINKKYSLKELSRTLHQIYKKLKRDITFEYTLIAGENDSREEAQGVSKLARSLSAKVNLIPYNPIQEMDFRTPDQETIESFANTLKRNGVRVTVRQTAGRDINAACGQLRLTRQIN